MLDRNPEAEISVVGSILIDPRCIDKITFLSSEDFTHEPCAIVFEAATDAHKRGKSYDWVSAEDDLKRRLSDAEARQFAMDCVNLTVTAQNVVEHAKIVQNHAGKRKLKEAFERIALECDSAEDMASTAITECQTFLSNHKTSQFHTLSDALSEMYDGKTRKSHRIDTGYPRLDGILKGMWGGNLILIGARPGVGKSALAVDIALSAALKGNSTALFSLEMAKDEIAERLVARYSGVEMDKLIDNTLTEQDWREVAKASAWLSEKKLDIVDDVPRLTISKIRALARTKPDLKLIVVDYIQLMTPEGRHDKRYQDIGSISRGLKLLAKELRIPIVALSQLNRESDATKRPELRDLRESGDLEQDADKVVFLWQYEEMPEGAPQKIGFYVAKNRRGKRGITINMFDGAHMRFTETQEQYKPKKRSSRVFDG